MSLLVFLLRRSKAVVAFSIATAAVSGIGGMVLIAMIQGELARPEGGSAAVGIAFAGLGLLVAASRVVAQVAIARLGQGTVTRLATRLCRDLLNLPLEAFERIDGAKVLAVLTEDIVIVSSALAGIPQLAINGPLVAICLAYAAWLSPAVFVSGVVVGGLAIAAYLSILAPAGTQLRRARAGQDALVSDYRTLIDGFRELKQHGRRRWAFLERSVTPHAEAVRDRSIAGQSLFALAEGWGELAFFGFLGFLLFVLPRLHAIDRPTLIGAVLVALYVMGPIDVILNWMPALGRARASIARIATLLNPIGAYAPDLVEPDRPALRLREEIRLEGVEYAYLGEDEDGGGFRLGPIDLALRPGEMIVLAGANGSGKTTLVKLLSGLYEPTAGRVLLDGEPIEEPRRAAYRDLFSVVFADGHVFRELHGLEAPDLDARAHAGLERLGLEGRVEFRRGAFSTLDLSQGQRRRLALLTAFLEDRPVCVFDEWAANQDPASRRMFYREILPELKSRGKALLVISHDEVDFEAADRIIALREGRIVEGRGADAVVLAAGGAVS